MIGADPEFSTLALPTFDDNPSVGHPDVVDFGGAWNGYRYWMAYTPFPDDARENPHIAASNDLETWVEPVGLTNPVAGVVAGYGANSDTDLVILSDDTLALYFRPIHGAGNEAIYRTTSADGVTWSTPVEILTSPSAFTLLSPSVLIEDDTTFSMFTVNITLSGAARIQRRTSADGLSWSAASSSSTVPAASGTIWHIDVALVDANYHALVATQSPYRLHHWVSADGASWSAGSGLLDLSGNTWDQDGHYRGCLVYLPGVSNVAFDVFVTGMNGTPVFTSSVWTVGHYRRQLA